MVQEVVVVTTSSFIYQSDIRQTKTKQGNNKKSKQQDYYAANDDDDNGQNVNLHPSGILHSIRQSGRRRQQDQCFAWIDDVAHEQAMPRVLSHLALCGFDATAKFIPYSSKKNWMAKYPHAVPFLECDCRGRISILDSDRYPNFNCGGCNTAIGDDDNTGNSKKSRQGSHVMHPKMFPSALLLDAERTELHLQIYNYFSWLHAELAALETCRTGRNLVSKSSSSSGIVSVGSIPVLMARMRSAFRIDDEEEQEEGGGGDNEEEEAADSSLGKNEMANKQQQQQQQQQQQRQKKIQTDTPILEIMLRNLLRQKVKDKQQTQIMNQSNHNNNSNHNHSTALSFDDLFQRLQVYKSEHGHTCVSKGYKQDHQLGHWVPGLRRKMAVLKAKGKEFDVAVSSSTTTNATAATNNSTTNTTIATVMTTPSRESDRYFLTQDRIARLNDMGFVWSFSREKTNTWEESFEKLKVYREKNGNCNVPRKHELGEWVHGQRKLYRKKDAKFMAKRAPLLDKIGFGDDVQMMNTKNLSWDERFAQLVEFHRVNGHFNVPCPVPNPEVYLGDDCEIAEALGLYKWVNRLQLDYVSLQNGRQSIRLNGERIKKLIDIGFEFRGPKYTTVKEVALPEISWETRVKQLQSFLSEMGHLKVDASYRLFGNLGGWAVETSLLYKNWKDGKEDASPDMIAKFEQLSAMGFGFDVFRWETNRSWEDNFDELVKYKHQHGSTRVPTKYKADMRLGKWAFVQRKEYQNVLQGIPSKLTQSRLEKLESVEFDWEGIKPRGQSDE